jgi:4-hydroxy-4-methyl-2-oxoglutarate aldolase
MAPRRSSTVRQLPSPDHRADSFESDVAELAALGCSTVHEGSGLDCCVSSSIRPAWPGARLSGPAYTVKPQPGDNLAVQRAVRSAPSGSVLVVAGEGLEFAYLGELLAEVAFVRGLAGIVVDGCVRDVAAIQELGLAVFATGAYARRAGHRDEGVLGERVAIGNRTVETGDVVIGDADGVIVVPRREVPAVLAASRAHREAKTARIALIRAGIIPPVKRDELT